MSQILRPETVRKSPKNEYFELSMELSSINIALTRCIEFSNLSELPATIERFKEFFSKIDGSNLEFFRRPLGILHSLLISRMYYNKTFASPMYEYPLDQMRAYANSETEFRNLHAIYINALEASLAQEA